MLFELVPKNTLIQLYPLFQLLLCRNRILHILRRQRLQHRRYRFTHLLYSLILNLSLLDLIEVLFFVLCVILPQLLLKQLTLDFSANATPII